MLARGSGARRRARVAAHPLPPHVQRLLQLRRGVPAPLRRRGHVCRPHRAAAVLARRPGLPGPARRRRRQRRHGRHARARDGAGCRPRDDAAALPDLYREPPVRVRFRAAPAPLAPHARRLRPDALARDRREHAAVPRRAVEARPGETQDRPDGAPPARPRLRRRHPFHARLQAVGPARVRLALADIDGAAVAAVALLERLSPVGYWNLLKKAIKR